MTLGTRLDGRLRFFTAGRHKRTLSSILAYQSSGLVDLGSSSRARLFSLLLNRTTLGVSLTIVLTSHVT